MSRQLVVISGGVSNPSTTRLLADQLAQATRTQVSGRGESATVTVLELRELARDMATQLTTGVPTTAMTAANTAITNADGIIAVTPVFSASYSGLFKMFFDLLEQDALTDTPVLIAATAGSARHSLVLDYALRPLFSYARAIVVPTGVFAATDDFGASNDAASGQLAERVRRASQELAALVVRSAEGVAGFTPGPRLPAKPARGPEFTPFTELLRGHQG